MNISHCLRLGVYKQRLIPCALNIINHKIALCEINQNRYFSVQSSVKSSVTSQNGIFQSISESTFVEYLQKFLVSMHDYCGMPWWATIISTTILFRSCITVPFAIYQQNILSKVENISLEMPAIAKELQKETSMAVKLYNWDEKTAKYQYKRSLKKQWTKLIVRDNCHPFKASTLLWFQIPLWICYSISLRNLVYLLPKGDLDAQITYIELTMGGFAWIPNLTAIDGSYIFPVMLGLINLTIIELQTLSKSKPSTKLQKYMTHFFRAVSVGMIPIAAYVPSCLVLYWTTSSAYGLIQNLVLMSPQVKRLCRIPQTPSELSNPYLHVVNGFKNKYLSSKLK